MEGKIALEEHFVTPELLDTIFPNIGWDQDEWQLVTELLQDTDERRLQAMDAGGIQTCVLSLTAPCIQDIVGASDAISAARHANDALAEIVRRSPDRYAGFAALPHQDPSAAPAVVPPSGCAPRELDRGVAEGALGRLDRCCHEDRMAEVCPRGLGPLG